MSGAQLLSREVTLWQMLVWVYRDQKAHRYLRSPREWFLWALCETFDDMPRPSVHADAALVHAALLEFEHRDAELLVFFAAEGEQPEIPHAVPRPYPTAADRSMGIGEGARWSWAEIAGRRIDYLIRWTDYVQEPRSADAESGVPSPLPRAVEFCPLSWEPDPEWMINQLVIHRDWCRAMAALYGRIRPVRLRDHSLRGIGIAAQPAASRLRELLGAHAERQLLATAPQAVPHLAGSAMAARGRFKAVARPSTSSR